MLSKSLQLTFRNATGKNVIVTIPEPKTPLTDAEVKTAMEAIITGNYFQSASRIVAMSFCEPRSW